MLGPATTLPETPKPKDLRASLRIAASRRTSQRNPAIDIAMPKKHVRRFTKTGTMRQMRIIAASMLVVGLLILGLPSSASQSPEATALEYMPPGFMSAPLRNADAKLLESIGAEVLSRQYQALMAMPDVKVQYASNGTPRYVAGSTGIYIDEPEWTAETSAPDVLERLKAILLATGTEELRTRIVTHGDARSSLGPPKTIARFDQYIRGIPVLGSTIVLSIDVETKEVRHITSAFFPDRGLPTKARLSPGEAQQAAANELSAMRDSAETKVVYSDPPPSLAYEFKSAGAAGTSVAGDLVWIVYLSREAAGLQDHYRVHVSATSGRVTQIRPRNKHARNRQVYSANYTAAAVPTGLTWLFGEGGTAPDTTSLNAYNNAGAVYAAWSLGFGRDSMNGAGGPINLAVHRVHHRPGIAWYDDTSKFLVFSEGDSSYKDAGDDLETVAHEFGHGVVDAHVSLDVGEADAIDEAFGDFSALLADWHVSAGSLSWGLLHPSNVNPAIALRRWDIPVLSSADQGFGFMFRDWYPTRTLTVEQAGSYFNSTIFGHAFYLLVIGGTHNRALLPGTEVPTIPVPGQGYNVARTVFYAALQVLPANATYHDLRYATLIAASTNSTVMQAVATAWDAVGVGYGCTAPPATPNLNSYLNCPFWRVVLGNVPGATTYNIEYSGSPAFLHSTVTGADGPAQQQCEVWSNVPVYTRGRACNGCGCSGWSYVQTLVPWEGDCP